MLIEKWLVISAHRTRYSWKAMSYKSRLAEREPSLAGNEVAVKIKLELPEALFKRPKLVANLEIPQEAVPKTEITTEVTTNIEKIIKETTGLEMRLSIVPFEEPQQETDTDDE